MPGGERARRVASVLGFGCYVMSVAAAAVARRFAQTTSTEHRVRRSPPGLRGEERKPRELPESSLVPASGRHGSGARIGANRRRRTCYDCQRTIFRVRASGSIPSARATMIRSLMRRCRRPRSAFATALRVQPMRSASSCWLTSRSRRRVEMTKAATWSHRARSFLFAARVLFHSDCKARPKALLRAPFYNLVPVSLRFV
jgi:hypothetical protein